MTRPRDNQRSRVYRWQSMLGAHNMPLFRTVDEVADWLKPIWRAERGRYGHARMPMPEIHHGHWGQRQGIAYTGQHRMSLPRWARQPWTILHEAAHLLTPRDEAHGPRFVGVLIGLAARHMGHDADALMAAADAQGVRYDMRSIGAVPVIPLAVKVLPLLPGTDIEIALQLGLSYRAVRGAALQLVRKGYARWRGQTLVKVSA